MARTTWWRVGLALLLAAALVSWLVGYGLPDWMLTNQSPVRNVLEALSWPASVLAFLWIAVPSVLKWTRRSDAEPTDSAEKSLPPATTMRSHHGSGITIQAGRDIVGKSVLTSVPPPGGEPAEPALPASDES